MRYTLYMKFLKGVVLFFAAISFSGLLFLTASFFTLWTVISQPVTIKGWLKDSGIYSSVIDEVAKQTSLEQSASDGQPVLSGGDVATAAKSAFTPEIVQTNSEKVIDSVFDWLKGKTPAPEFSLDLSGQKSALAEGLASSLADKAKQLPPCTGSLNSTTQADLSSLTCLPTNLDISKSEDLFANDFISSSNLLPSGYLNSDILKVTDSEGKSQPLAAAFSKAPTTYRALLWAPWVSLGLLVLSTLGLIFVSTKRRKGLKRVARGFGLAGGLLVAVGFLLVPAANKLLVIGNNNSLTAHVVMPLLNQAWKHVAHINLIIGISYLVVSIILYLIVFFTRSKDAKDAVETTAAPQAPLPQGAPTPQLTVQASPTNDQSQAPAQPAYRPPMPAPQPTPQPTPPTSTPSYRTDATQAAPTPTTQTTVKRPPMIQG